MSDLGGAPPLEDAEDAQGRIDAVALRDALVPRKRGWPPGSEPWPPSLFVSPQRTAELVAVLLDVVEAAHAEMRQLAVAPRGAFPTEDRLRDALARFDFGDAR